MRSINGVSDIETDDKRGKEEINIIPDYPSLARFGLTVAEIAQTVRVAYDGQIATVTRYGDEDVNFRVIMENGFRRNIRHLRNLKVPDNKGGLVNLEDVAKFSIYSGVSAIYHEDGEPTVTIAAEIDGAVITPLEVLNVVKRHFNFSKMRSWTGIRIDVRGEAAESREAVIDISIAFAIAALGIYFLLVLLFNSVTQPLVVLFSIPFGICGVIIAYGLHGQMSATFFGGIGVIGLAGVVVNDSLVMVDHLNSILAKHKGDFIAQIAAGAANRLRPVILTTVTTVAGLLPLVYGIGGADSMMGPMALSLGYGLLFATPVTLIVLPCMYAIGMISELQFKSWLEKEINDETCYKRQYFWHNDHRIGLCLFLCLLCAGTTVGESNQNFQALVTIKIRPKLSVNVQRRLPNRKACPPSWIRLPRSMAKLFPTMSRKSKASKAEKSCI